MRFKDFLNEEKIVSSDIRTLEKYIKKFPTGEKSFVLKSFSNYDDSERKVIVYRDKDKNLNIEYNSDFYEITALLVDVVDSIDDMNFKTDENKGKTIFKIMKKE